MRQCSALISAIVVATVQHLKQAVREARRLCHFAHVLSTVAECTCRHESHAVMSERLFLCTHASDISSQTITRRWASLRQCTNILRIKLLTQTLNTSSANACNMLYSLHVDHALAINVLLKSAIALLARYLKSDACSTRHSHRSQAVFIADIHDRNPISRTSSCVTRALNTKRRHRSNDNLIV